MFQEYLTLAEALEVTAIGLSMVFLVLFSLEIMVRLISSFAKEKENTVATPVPPSASNPIPTVASSSISPKEKAIIMAAILESLNITDKKNKVRITRIQKIS